ncbi:MAG: hypothetical protein HYZ27_08755 [Deltaproteobacteria bacterium]|nr:hypothetical protein [Deltaproteobacteria bacterium]
MLGVVAAALLAQTPAPSDPGAVDDELRRARNEYMYGNYTRAVDLLKDLLYPMRLSTDAQVIEARQYLALSYYLLHRLDEMGDEFAKLLHLEPDYDLDPFTVPPAIIEMFESIRKQLKPQLDALRQLRADKQLTKLLPGVRVEVQTRVTERSQFATFMPFGIGQFQNGQVGWGVAFAVTELVLLGINVAAFVWASELGGNNGYLAEDRPLVQGLLITQYASLAMFGVVWSLGVMHARLHFIPEVTAPQTVREVPLSSQVTPPDLRQGSAPGLQLTLTW